MYGAVADSVTPVSSGVNKFAATQSVAAGWLENGP